MKVRGGGAVRGGGGGGGRAAAAVTAAVGPAELPVPAAGHAAAPAAHLRSGGARPSPGELPVRAASGSAVLGRLSPPGRPRRYGRDREGTGVGAGHESGAQQCKEDIKAVGKHPEEKHEHGGGSGGEP